MVEGKGFQVVLLNHLEICARILGRQCLPLCQYSPLDARSLREFLTGMAKGVSKEVHRKM
jgi:hypothetical protein